jgi:hypothetical protein
MEAGRGDPIVIGDQNRNPLHTATRNKKSCAGQLVLSFEL